MALMTYARLRAACLHYQPVDEESEERSQEHGETPGTVTNILLQSWSFIDSVNRLRVLLQAAPGFKKNAPGLQVLLRATENVEGLRNYVQHLGEESLKVAERGHPIWGSLSWVETRSADTRTVAARLLIPGRLAVSSGYPMVNPAGKSIRPPIDLISLTANELTVSLTDAADAVARFRRRLELALGRGQIGGDAVATIVIDAD